MKNIVFIINVEKPGQTKPEYQFSIDSWKQWCDTVGAELFVLDQPLVDMDQMHIIWQRYYLFELLDHNKIEYDQILLVDADTIVHPQCPDFFKETNHEYCMVHDDGSYDWILRGMEHYEKRIFKGEWFPFWEYGNSGFQIVNSKHRDFFDAMRNFYTQHQNTIRLIQSSFGIGTDQTPLNFMLRKHNIDLKLLPYKYNMTCMTKKEIIGEDHLYTKLGWVYHFNGLPDKSKNVPLLMEKAYNYLYR